MLLIWDIHITTRIADRLIQDLESFFEWQKDEKHLVFLWDFVYHFNYDRKSLMKFYELCLRLVAAWKHIYLLAWNHDRIQTHFVYEEAKKSFEVLGNAFSQGELWKIEFITEPCFKEIEGENILFFPYTLLPQEEITWSTYQELIDSSHAKEQVSWRANHLLQKLIYEWKQEFWEDEILTIMHHWYTVNTPFPGQFARFSYKSPGLDDGFMDMSNIRMISWHLHKPFSHKNYLCCWSVRYTSPLEVQQIKFLFRFDTKTNTFHAFPVLVNPYLRLEIQEGVVYTKELLFDSIREIFTAQCLAFSAEFFDISYEDLPDIRLVDRTVTLVSNLPYHELEDIFPLELRALCKEVKVKQSKQHITALTELLDTWSKELDTRISDWKSLLKQYIDQKYWNISDQYIKELHDLWVDL